MAGTCEDTRMGVPFCWKIYRGDIIVFGMRGLGVQLRLGVWPLKVGKGSAKGCGHLR